jgi:Cdc6-like AAA superfamily ATPase
MYGMKEEHYAINPRTEHAAFFVRQSEFKRFYDDLLGTLASGRVPRYVIFGSFGVGKTHFLYHLKNQLSEKATVIYLQTPPSHRRTSFIEFYSAIISEIGRSQVNALLAQGLKKPERMKDLGMNEDLVHVIETATSKGEEFLLWKFLSGIKLKATEADKIEALRPELTADDAVAILNTLSAMQRESGGKPIVLLVDEFENTGHIGGDAKIIFTEAVRAMVDEASKVGVIFALTARSTAEMPAPVIDEPVKRRIGLTNYLQIRDYDEAELAELAHNVIHYRRDPKFDVKKAIAAVKTDEKVSPESYPFSEEAVQQVVSSVIVFAEQGRIDAKRPKEVLEIMDRALREATSKKAEFISSKTIDEVREDVVEAMPL